MTKSISTIERVDTGIEKDGTGIEKDGTGIEKDGTGIEKDGTGIGMNRWLRRGRFAAGTFSLILAAALSMPPAFATAPVGGDGTGAPVGGDGTGAPVGGDGTGQRVGGDGTGQKVGGDGTGDKIASPEFGVFIRDGAVGTLLIRTETAQYLASVPRMREFGTGRLFRHELAGSGIDVGGDGTGQKVGGDGTGQKVGGDGTGDRLMQSWGLAEVLIERDRALVVLHSRNKYGIWIERAVLDLPIEQH